MLDATVARHPARQRCLVRPGICAAVLGATLALFCVVFPAFAAQEGAQVEQKGELPRQGRVVLRSGMAWLDESSTVFQKMAAAFGKELTARGLVVVAVKPSVLEPMPKTPLPNKHQERDVRKPRDVPQGAPEAEAAQKAGELGKEGKLPKLKLRGYTTPDSDRELPESVRSITSPDVARSLYARSQQAGKPVVQSFAVPGRMPGELETDANVADYAIIIRFAAVRSWASPPEVRPVSSFGSGVLVAASTISGTGALGFGVPAQPVPPGRDTYGTPGGYARGYEGSARNDFWNRDSDFFQRDYQFNHGPQPNYATPPSGLATSRGERGFGVKPLPGRGHGPSVTGWHLILFDGFDLAPVKKGKKPVRIWQAAVRGPGEVETLEKSLPKMIRALFATKEQ